MTGDVIGEFSFPAPLAVGSRIVFTDMMQYSFVKSTVFNGTPRPDLAMLEEDGTYRVLKSYGYDDFRHLLGDQSAPNRSPHRLYRRKTPAVTAPSLHQGRRPVHISD